MLKTYTGPLPTKDRGTGEVIHQSYITLIDAA
jgi:hypothetical protein